MKQYKLLTPGPLTTTSSVKAKMQVDHCTWDDDYKSITRWIREQLLALAQCDANQYSSVLMQGSGTFGVESAVSSLINPDSKALVLHNGVYGKRIVTMLKYAKRDYVEYGEDYKNTFDLDKVREYLDQDDAITHVIVVHSETTTGMLNDVEAIGKLTHEYNKTFIVDAMSSFGGIPMAVQDWHIDCLISSANKCIQGVPGFSFIIAKRDLLEASKGQATTLSLDLYDQWQELEKDNKWRFTSPTHVVLAFAQAIQELHDEGGIEARYQRYKHNNQLMRQELAKCGIRAYIDESLQSPFITTFMFPDHVPFNFKDMYEYIKARGFVIYPGKLTDADTFRLGNIGEIYEEDVRNVTHHIASYIKELQDAK
ncbi:2-aminoethylphosphonate--pyruvate transaminase [Brackiella oedipodis]|uniref:2-aminoethylphosphonate--pyruvate transaminase n=1 Tax=Brackiella oedipodis TaxID=124225 RepID=UPI00048B21BC|nr:2-aminoethylphosphonate--pyruvate transaminase [Brackiella oedipodis]